MGKEPESKPGEGWKVSQGKPVSGNEEGVDSARAHQAYLAEYVGKMLRVEEDPVHGDQGLFAHSSKGKDDPAGGQGRDILLHDTQGIPVFLEVGGQGFRTVGSGRGVGPPEKILHAAFEPDPGTSLLAVLGESLAISEKKGVGVVGSDQDQISVRDRGNPLRTRDGQVDSR